ncbi:hypothetical protein Ahy_B03g062794 isoform C [Arachis hypogaea]|uniref:Uncharacterized protein n=1 Tax=Arachis hypogaea TaxID=3818 RepID=A0A444ZVG7_ARAHY|nr:hypothetical protein Ahy_B03g062794 isoform C [Arachis hypogaea]
MPPQGKWKNRKGRKSNRFNIPTRNRDQENGHPAHAATLYIISSHNWNYLMTDLVADNNEESNFV